MMSPWADLPPPPPELAAVVVVPVRNEATRLSRTLQAIAAQRLTAHRPYEVLLLANNCDDHSAQIARAFAAGHPQLVLHVAETTLPPPLAHIGHVRCLLMDAACDRLLQSGRASDRPGVIASTDGDTEVAPDWLHQTLQAVYAGADAVGGRILTDHDGETAHDPAARRWQRCDTAYRLARERLASLLDPDPADPWPRHHQHFCASLAVTARAYRQVGGVPDVRYLEDEALVAALRREDFAVRHSPLVRVLTSGRLQGRVEVGLSWQLRQWSEQAQAAPSLMLEDAQHLLRQLPARRRLRALWQARDDDFATAQPEAHRCAVALGVDGEWLTHQLATARTFGLLWEQVQACGAERPRPLVPARQAIDELRALIGRYAAAAETA